MVIQQGGKSHQAEAWKTQAVRIIIRNSHLTCKIANKCPNVLSGWNL